jgi:tetratricopeptide (TPR) repeat protein
LAIQLEGTRSNRDAIGARVEVVLSADSESDTPQPRRLVQSLRAGEGYLSQSSKTLHFGIEPHARIDHLIVSWPSGLVQRIEGLETGSRYHVLEGREHAERLAPRSLPVVLAPKLQPEPTAANQIRTLLGTRIPIPILRYTTTVDEQPVSVESNNRPLIVTLWASWCPSCLAELADLCEHAGPLREAGAEVLALNVDQLDVSHAADAGRVMDRLRQLQFSHANGFATRETLDKLERLQSLIFSRQPPAAVPMTYLIDRDGKLAAIYQGRVDIVQLLADLAALELPADAWRDRAVPFAGRWSQPPRELLTAAMARYFLEAGYREDYTRFLVLDAQELSQRIAAASAEPARDTWLQRYAQAHFSLGVELMANGDASSAAEYYMNAVRAMPNHHDARLNLGAILARQGKVDEAIEHLQQALASNVNSLAARTNLAAAWEAKHEYGRAAEQYRELLKHDPTQNALRARFGRALIETGHFSEAVEQFKQIVEADPDDFRSLLCLAWLHATSPDEAIRDGGRAAQYARRIAELRGLRDPVALDLLAAAAAAQGDFSAARAHIQTALEVVAATSSPMIKTLQEREAVYAQEQTIRDADGKYP